MSDFQNEDGELEPQSMQIDMQTEDIKNKANNEEVLKSRMAKRAQTNHKMRDPKKAKQ